MSNNQLSAELIREYLDVIILNLLGNSNKYGYEICKLILQKSQNKYELKETTLYLSLRRMEKEQLITAYWNDESGEKRRKYYKITASGETYYQEKLNEWLNAKEVLNLLIIRN